MQKHPIARVPRLVPPHWLIKQQVVLFCCMNSFHPTRVVWYRVAHQFTLADYALLKVNRFEICTPYIIKG